MIVIGVNATHPNVRSASRSRMSSVTSNSTEVGRWS